MSNTVLCAFLILVNLAFLSCATNPPSQEKTVNYLKDFPPTNPDSTLNAVIEIPAGTNEKWEVNKETGQLFWEKVDGVPRVVQYLPYIGNYGMIPGTLLPKELGGDGDPLDILVLGPSVPRGTVLKVHVIGVLKLLDSGEIDDKLIGVTSNSHFGEIHSMMELDQEMNGVKEIIQTWFENYKGKGKMEVLGFEDKEVAIELLEAAIKHGS